jgi:hypothetical protein
VLRDYANQRLRREDISTQAVTKLLHALGFEKLDDERPRGFLLPPLPEARAAWDRRRFKVAWDGIAEWAASSGDFARGKPEVPF